MYLHQANKKIAIPFLISSKGYGLLLTTQSPAIFTDIQYGSYFYTEDDYFLDYFLSVGPAANSVANMRLLTGKAVSLPDYAYGYIQSQEHYESQQEILDTAAEFKRRGIPLSLIVLDQLHRENVHFMISIWPSMDEHSDNYKEMAKNQSLLTGINICNAFDPKARELYWKQAKAGTFLTARC